MKNRSEEKSQADQLKRLESQFTKKIRNIRELLLYVQTLMHIDKYLKQNWGNCSCHKGSRVVSDVSFLIFYITLIYYFYLKYKQFKGSIIFLNVYSNFFENGKLPKKRFLYISFS